MTRRALHGVLVPALLVLLLGCGNKEQPAAGGGTAQPGAKAEPKAGPAPESKAGEKSDFQKPLLEGLKKAGFAVGEFETTAAKPYQARACSRGEVSKLDVMACQYESEDAAKRAEPALAQFVGGAGSGAVRRSGTLTLAVADRSKVDPRGLVLDKLLKSFMALGLR